MLMAHPYGPVFLVPELIFPQKNGIVVIIYCASKNRNLQ